MGDEDRQIPHAGRLLWESEGDIGRGQTTRTVVVKQPEVEHKVRMRDFEAWLQSNGRSPAEMVLKSRLRELLSK
jgi:hypothetical protein